jgi:hypothetical protein
MSAALPALTVVLAILVTVVPAGAQGQESFGGTGRSGHVPNPDEWAASPRARHPRDGRRCARIGQVRTCTTYRRGRAVRVCVLRGRGPERCARRAAASQALTTEGWAPGPSPMGRLWIARGATVAGRCSGTLNTADVVVTAAHCLWDDDGSVTGRGRGYVSDAVPMTFVPGNAFAANGTAGEAATAVSPFGSWRVARSYVPTCWADEHDPRCDIGIVRLRTRGGRHAGDVAGTFAAEINACCGPGQDVVAGGYPASGPMFASYAGAFGNAPFFCGGRPALRAQLTGCTMTGGASGGPVWAAADDGADRIVGVITRAGASGTTVVFQPFDGVFGDFYCRVTQCPGRDSNPHAR